jgi:hypothetical protein
MKAWLAAFRHGLSVLLLGLSAWLVLECVSVVREVRALVVTLPGYVDVAVTREAAALRADINTESRAWRGLVANQAESARRALLIESAQWRRESLSEFAVARSDLTAVLDRRSGELVRTTQAPAVAATALLEEYRRLPAAVGSRLDPWTDCAGNGACWQAQWTALLGASRVTAGETSRTMRTIREATPAIVANVDQTTANVARITKPDSLAIRLLKLTAPVAGGVLFGAMK